MKEDLQRWEVFRCTHPRLLTGKALASFVARRPGWIHGVGGLTLVPPSGKNSRLETNTDFIMSYPQTSFVMSNWSRCLEVLK